MRKVAVAQLKGGVGKSTLTLFLAENWSALRKLRVLVLDLDPQSSVTFMLLPRSEVNQWEATHKTLPHLFEDIANGVDNNKMSYVVPRVSDLRELHVSRANHYISLLPTIPKLWFHAYEFDKYCYMRGADPVVERTLVLQAFLEAVGTQFDCVLMDCPPGFGTLTRSALALAEHIVAPTISEVTSVRSLGDFIDIGLRDTLGKQLSGRLHVVVSRHGNTLLQRQELDRLRELYGDKMVPGVIPDRDQVRHATTILSRGDQRSYAQKYERPLLNRLAPHVERVAADLYEKIFKK